MTDDPQAPPFRPPDRRMIPNWNAEGSGGPGPTASPPRAGRRPVGAAGRPGFDGRADADGPAVRPFVITGGRTRADERLRVETLLQAAGGPPAATLRFEPRRIVEICSAAATSVAEVAAALGVPLGVARVLVTDLVAGGSISVVRSDQQLSTQMIERIRDRVRSL
ncbi:DUF742 domain-containing protein [Spongisporangium articulatum]|uniref:DUF742 domain-containing protein n=1 Tax=Spongisporangium articulatum TaxID=3362603 RepID=A0ABW8AH79_9ACTN